MRYEANADRARKAEAEGDELAQSLEEELSQSMQDVEDLWREKHSALEESHKELLKLKGEMEQKIEQMGIHETEAERQHKELRERFRALKDTVTLHHQAQQRALSSRQSDGQTIQRLRQQVNSVRREMAEWAGGERGEQSQTESGRITDQVGRRPVENRRIRGQRDTVEQPAEAAETDTESYRRWCEKSQEDLRLERNANKEAMKVSMQATHYLLNEKSALQKVTEIRLETKEAQEMLQNCKLEIDHLQHKLDRRERQLTTAENEVRLVQEQSAGKQEEIDSLTTSLEDMKLQWDELSGARDAKHRRVVGSPETLALFPPVQERETEEVQVRRTIAVAYDIHAVQRGDIIEHPRRITYRGNVLTPIMRVSTEELMKCMEKFTKARIAATRRELEEKAFERGVLEGMRRQQLLEAAMAADGVIFISDSDAE